MNPKLNLFLALLLLAVAGVPLYQLTATKVHEAPPLAAAPAEAQQQELIYADLRVSGTPTSIILTHEGRLLAHLAGPCAMPWEWQLALPAAAQRLGLEL